MTSTEVGRKPGPSRHSALPPTLAPRGLSRDEAAAYIGVSPRMFDEMVRDGRMPKAKRINARAVWDRRRIDTSFDDLPSPDDVPRDDGWDDVD